MKLSRILYSLCTLLHVVSVASGSGSSVQSDPSVGDEPERKLQISITACRYVSNALFNGGFICDCDLGLLNGDLVLQCATNKICSPNRLFCAVVEVGIYYELFSQSLPDVEFCLFNATFGPNIPILKEPFCIGPDLLGNATQRSCRNGLASCIASGEATSITKPTASVKGCEIRIGPKKCKSCSPCNRRGGVTFDCSNVVAGLKTTTCAQFTIPTGLGSKARPALPDVILNK